MPNYSVSLRVLLTAFTALLFAGLPVFSGTGLDSSFDSDGKKVTRVSPAATGRSVANTVIIEPSTQKIIAGGGGIIQGANFYGFAVARFFPDGPADQTFNNGTGFNVVTMLNGGQPSDGFVNGLGVQPLTNKIVAAGVVSNGNNHFVVVVRFNGDGTFDNTFAVNGYFVSQFNSVTAYVSRLAIAPDGSILLAGYTGNDFGRNFLLAKLTVNGTLDPSFGSGSGFVTTDFNGAMDQANTIAIEPVSGTIVLGGRSSTGGAEHNCAIARYLSNGSPDLTLGGSGRLTTNVASGALDEVRKILITSGGVITAIGIAFPAGTIGEKQVLIRYSNIGTLDSSFGAGGIASANFGNNQEIPSGAAILPNGKIVVAGYVAGTVGIRMATARFNTNGSVDRGFGCNGIILTAFQPNSTNASTFAYGLDMVIDANGRVVVAGQGSDAVITNDNFAIARLLNSTTPMQCAIADSDGDGISDVSVVRPDYNGMGNAAWYRRSSVFTNFISSIAYGLSADQFVPADYDGDGRTDLAVARDGVWYIRQSTNNQTRIVQWGIAGDLMRPGDHDGDGKADITVFRPSTGTWYSLRSSDAQLLAVQFGQMGDIPVQGDFDGDRKADVAVFRPENNYWYILRSSDGMAAGFQFGANGDVPVSGDFNGDGTSDLAVFRPSNGTWYYAPAVGVPAQNFIAIQFGAIGDRPVPGDYDGDGRSDVAVFRSGVWWILNSSNGLAGALQFGVNSDLPLEAAYLP